jgi:hypothetical protein
MPRSLPIYLKPNYNKHDSNIVLEYKHVNFLRSCKLGLYLRAEE